ncbi:MAG TPA: RHS repeat domain-containing protein, partial [Chloroflexia bacterium]|nr:RHS repeat domain-containing protein [Chloroflexia bacterium]
MTYPTVLNAGVVTHTYDAANRLTGVSDWLSHQTSFSYDADSNLTTERYPNGITATLAYDARDSVTAITDTLGTNAPFLALSYTRDPLALLGSEGAPHTYSYDPRNRLTSDSPMLTGDNWSWTY